MRILQLTLAAMLTVCLYSPSFATTESEAMVQDFRDCTKLHGTDEFKRYGCVMFRAGQRDGKRQMEDDAVAAVKQMAGVAGACLKREEDAKKVTEFDRAMAGVEAFGVVR